MSCADDSLAAFPVIDGRLMDMWHGAMSVVPNWAVSWAYYMDLMGFVSK